MSDYVTMTIPKAVRDDFIDDYGYEKLVTNLGGEKPGMRDSWNAVEFARPKGQSTYTLTLHPKMPSILRPMFEVRWADHFSMMSELEAPYARVVDQLKKLANSKR